MGIPITDNCILALHLDYEKGQEHFLVGELFEVQRYLRGNKQAAVLADERREIGALAKACFHPAANDMANLRIGLCDGLGKKKTPLFETARAVLENLYQADVPCYRFLAVRLWQEYHKAKRVSSKRIKSVDDHTYINTLIDRIEDLTLPFRFSIESDIMNWQCDHPQYPLHYFDEEYTRHPCGLLWANNLKSTEYGFASVSLMPLLMYELKQIYDRHLYFQRCKLCGNLFLARTANISTYCGEGCKREAMRLNKQRFDSKAKELDYERQHKNAYMYWYNKVKKAQKSAADPERLAAVLEAFEVFKSENIQRKTAVKEGRMPEREYTDWLYQQQREADLLLEQV